jgi:sugar phosphate isomerase/epimerase
MNLSRRDFVNMMFAGVPVLTGAAQAAPSDGNNRSVIHGVQFGLQPFCYHDLPMNIENRRILIDRMVQNGLGMVELHATWCEPNFTGGNTSATEARKKLRDFRLTTGRDYYQAIKREFDQAGIAIFTSYVTFNDSYTDAEIDAVLEGAKALGAKGVVGSYGLAVSRRLAPFLGKHGMFAGLHNHDNLSDPDAYSTEQTFIKGLDISPDFRATLDVRHFTAGNGDCVGFLERNHNRTSSIHLGDRRRNNGHSTPFGQGDSPIIEILRLIRDNEWPIVALLEFEHGTLRTGVEEVQIAFDYCKRALE